MIDIVKNISIFWGNIRKQYFLGMIFLVLIKSKAVLSQWPNQLDFPTTDFTGVIQIPFFF